MAYIGAEPVPGQNREVDDISSGFNGNATAFTLQVSSVNVSPESANNILINLGGVLQNPGTDYTIAASTITFTTAPAAGLSFFGLILGAGINTATVADQTIGTSKILDNAVTADKLAHTSVTAGSYTTADITVDAQGRVTAAANGTIATAEIADGAVNNAKVNASAAIDVSKLSGVMPLAGGTFTGDVTFDGQTAGRDIIFDRSDNSLGFGDNTKIRIGNSQDLEIYHDGSDSFIADAGTGSLKILSNQTQIINAANSENIANFNQDGTVELFHNNGRKFQTLSTGINVYGSGSTFLELGSVAGGTDSVFIDTSHASNTKPNMDFKLDGDLALRIDTSGNLNIGLTSSPVSSNSEQGVFLAGADATQSVISSSTTPLVINRVGTGGNDRNCVELRNNGTLRGTIGALGAQDGIFFQHGTSESGRINSDGKFLLGTTDATGKIHARGNTASSGNFTASVLTPSGDHYIHVSNANTGGSEQAGLVLNASGSASAIANIFIEKTNSYIGNLVLRMRDGAGSSQLIKVIQYNGETQHFYGSSTTVKEIYHWTNNTTGMSFRSANIQRGNIFFFDSGVQFNTSSDYRLKENVTTISDGISRIKQLIPRKFNWIVDESNTPVDGFLAHEVSSIVPEAVNGTKDAVATQEDVDSHLAEKVGDPIHQMIDHSKLVPLLTASLQEAITKIETLETKVAALEAA